MLKKITGKSAVLLIISLMGCSTQQLTHDIINKSLSQTADRVNSYRSAILRLDKEGAPGYYYIIDSRGRIIYHPEKSLIGKDFSRYAFVQKILDEKNGSFALETGGKNTSVFYRELRDGSVLCYTIESSRYTVGRE